MGAQYTCSVYVLTQEGHLGNFACTMGVKQGAPSAIPSSACTWMTWRPCAQQTGIVRGPMSASHMAQDGASLVVSPFKFANMSA